MPEQYLILNPDKNQTAFPDCFLSGNSMEKLTLAEFLATELKGLMHKNNASELITMQKSR